MKGANRRDGQVLATNPGADRDASMLRYHFNLHDGHGVCRDLDGTVLPRIEAAHEYGITVANELMRNREPRARPWKLDVCDTRGEVLFAIEFAQIDPTLEHLPAEVREATIHLSKTMRAVGETIADCRMTVLQSKALLALADGKPYVAADSGRRI